MLAQTVGLRDTIAIIVYLMLVGYLGWLGYRRTKTASDYMVAGRKTHPFVMAMSYGATFISTSAIVGFGGVAGLFGMSLLWLTFLNIFFGIFVAFVFLGGPARRMGHRLDAHTFPELIGRRYDSRFIQIFSGLVITIFIPLYAAAVLIGGCKFLASQLGLDYNTALLVFSVIIAAYVVVGGLKGVMYTDALQGTIMFVGMLVLLVGTYALLGGIVPAHQSLTDLGDLVPGKLQAIGHQGWTALPPFGWGDTKHDLWWIVISTIALGVGIGVLAQPQLVVRFMTVRSKRELNRAVLIGGVFILIMTGVAFTVGSLSNAYFAQQGPLMTGIVAKEIDPARGHVVIHVAKKDDAGAWTPVMKPTPDGKTEPALAPVVLDKAQPYLDAAVGDKKVAQGRSISVVYAGGDPEEIIPRYIKAAMPSWFGTLFLLTLLAAAMSTLSSQYHALGTSLGRDVFETLATKRPGEEHPWSILVVRIGIVLGIIAAAVFGYYAKESEYIIARATAIFFGLCASAFLPAFVGGLFWKRMTKAGAITSMVVGFLVTMFWLVFIKAKEAEGLGIVQHFTGGKPSLLMDYPNWPVVDPLVVALPISIVVAVSVSLLTKPPSKEHLDKCF